jgi:hypothetical protein
LEADWRNGIHFGFDANDANIEVLVGKLCSSAFNYAVSMELTATSGRIYANYLACITHPFLNNMFANPF